MSSSKIGTSDHFTSSTNHLKMFIQNLIWTSIFFKVIFQCHLIYFRSRIGTETSIETSVENPTCIDRGVGNESFEEELLKVLNSRDDDEPNVCGPGV